MSLLSPILRGVAGNGLIWFCPGCKEAHQIRYGDGNIWEWNGDAQAPTFKPSVLIWWREPLNIGNSDALKAGIAAARKRKEGGATGDDAKIPMVKKQCHCWITNGMIAFLSDCTHDLAGQTVPIPPWPFELT